MLSQATVSPSLNVRKQLTFRHATAGCPAKCRNTILMTFTTQISVVLLIGRVVEKHYQDLGSERHQYAISTIFAQTSFRGKTSVGITNCQLLSSAIHMPKPNLVPRVFPAKPCNEVVKDDSVSSGLSIKRVTFTLKALKPCPCQHFATIGIKNSWDTFPKRSFREVFLTSTVLPRKKFSIPSPLQAMLSCSFELHGRDNKRPNLKFEGEGCRLFCCRL